MNTVEFGPTNTKSLVSTTPGNVAVLPVDGDGELGNTSPRGQAQIVIVAERLPVNVISPVPTPEPSLLAGDAGEADTVAAGDDSAESGVVAGLEVPLEPR